jgi:hypothetical protein
LLLHADAQECNRRGYSVLSGFVASYRELSLIPSRFNEFTITHASLPVTVFEEDATALTLTLRAGGGENSIWFRCAKAPQHVTFQNQPLPFEKVGKDYHLALPDFVERAELTVAF